MIGFTLFQDLQFCASTFGAVCRNRHEKLCWFFFIFSPLLHASKLCEVSIVPNPGDKTMFRRFLHKRPLLGNFQKPAIWSLPMRENLMEKLKIRLDGLAPPEPEPESLPVEKSGLTTEETKKLLRVAQLEAVKSKLREVQKSWVSYSESEGKASPTNPVLYCCLLSALRLIGADYFKYKDLK
ncbi:hypothetical protein DVH24_031361 [Malus domestica]|uniref:Uncharacterized protein n=1 Tax=Malus domestica TaxID=3750 RepID=A0A498HC32_MALDO|nr:hypothetical protein DVH24_031361 [Malus domestica]